jgi:hypothetical protein
MVTTPKGLVAFIPFVAVYLLAGCREPGTEAITGPIVSNVTAASSRGATTSTTNEKISPFGFDSEGCIEIVSYSGILHAVAHTTITSTGSIHTFVQFNPVGGVSAVGLTTGTKYVVPGMLHDNFNLEGADFPLTHTFVNNFQVIGAGSVPNLNLHETFHITINANGEITTAFDNVRAECQ